MALKIGKLFRVTIREAQSKTVVYAKDLDEILNRFQFFFIHIVPILLYNAPMKIFLLPGDTILVRLVVLKPSNGIYNITG